MSGSDTGRIALDELAHALTQVVGGLIVVLDRDGRVVEVNEEVCCLLGLDRDRIVGADWIARFVPARVRASVEQVQTAMRGGDAASVEHFENPVLTATGEERIILWHNAVLRDDDGKVQRLVGSGVDITDRVRLEHEQRAALAAAAASEQRYRTIFETAATPIARLDQHGTILDCNRASEKVFGHPAEAIKGRPATVLIHPDDHARLWGDLRDIHTLGVYHHRTYRAQHADGSELLIEVDAAALPLAQPDAYEIVCQVADVTAQARDLGLERLSARLLRIAHQHDDLHGLCQAFCAQIQVATGLGAVAVRRLMPTGGVEFLANLGFSESFVTAGNVLRRDAGCGCAEVLAGRTHPDRGPYTAGGSYVITDTGHPGPSGAEPWFGACHRACSKAGFRSLATIPVRHGEAILGALQVAAPDPGAIPPDMVQVLEDAALQLGQAMRRILAEQDLQRQLAFQQELLDAVPIPVCHLDPGGQVVGANRAWRRTVGEAADADGRALPLPPCADDEASDPDLHTARPTTQGRQIELRDTAGQQRRVALHRAQFRLPDHGEGGTILALVDVTDITRATAALQRLNAVLEGRVQERVATIQALFRLSRDLAHARSLGDIARAVHHQILAFMPPDLSLLAVVDGTCTRSWGRTRRALSPGVLAEIQRTLDAELHRLGLPVVAAPLEIQVDSAPGLRPAPPIHRLESNYLLPLQIEGRTRSLGVLLVAAERAGAFTEDQARAFHLAAEQVAAAAGHRRATHAEPRGDPAAAPPAVTRSTDRLDLRGIIDSLPDALVVLDPQQRAILANRAAIELFGLPAEGPPPDGLPLRALPLDAQRLEAALLPGSLREEGRFQADLRYHDILGRPGMLEAHLLPIEVPAWEGTTLLVARDATQRRALEHRLIQARKMESIGQLAAGIAHEINTPTQYVSDNLQFLTDSFDALRAAGEALRDATFPHGDELPPGSPEAIARDTREQLDLDYLLAEIPLALEQARDGVTRIASIVGAMREFSHGQGAEKVVTDINRCVRSTVTVARNEWKYVADLVLDLDPELPTIPTMANELNQVLLNLLTNAAQAIGEARPASGKGTITVRSERWERGVRVSVTDNGCGIPFELQPRVFEPFFTTKPVGRGTGQGLAISRAVVAEKLGGELDFDSTPGVGTTFRLTLPGGA